MPNPSKTEIAIVLDRSGSMQSVREDMEGGFRSFVQSQRTLPDECVLSLYQFDDRYEVVYEGRPLAEVVGLELEPRGSTALLDGVGKSIAHIGARHASLAEEERPATVVVLVITDGHENASHEWKLEGVRKAVTAAEKDRGWRFVFLGADPSAFDEGQRMGFGRSLSYVADSAGVMGLYGDLDLICRQERTVPQPSSSDTSSSSSSSSEPVVSGRGKPKPPTRH